MPPYTVDSTAITADSTLYTADMDGRQRPSVPPGAVVRETESRQRRLQQQNAAIVCIMAFQ